MTTAKTAPMRACPIVRVMGRDNSIFHAEVSSNGFMATKSSGNETEMSPGRADAVHLRAATVRRNMLISKAARHARASRGSG